jgi:hypothetical protein
MERIQKFFAIFEQGTIMKYLLSILICVSLSSVVFGQTCTISCPGTSPCIINWSNASPPVCDEGGGNAGSASIIIISEDVTLNINENGDIWTGIRIDVYGVLQISAPGQVTINSNIVVKSTGVLSITSKLNIGSSGGCGYKLEVESGGLVDLEGSTPDRLSICGREIARGGTNGCNQCPEVPEGSGTYDCNDIPLPYCAPPGGFSGPIDFDEDGVTPVELIYFNAKKSGYTIELKWATSKEEDFSHFVIQHAVNSLDFTDLDEVPGAGYNTESVLVYVYTHALPLIGHNYYRLKAVDLNGSFEYFGPVVERYQGTKALWVHPNPSSATKVEFKTNFTPNEGDRVQVFNSLGLLISDVPVDQAKGVVHFNEPVRAGSYILRYVSVQETTFARFVVIN